MSDKGQVLVLGRVPRHFVVIYAIVFLHGVVFFLFGLAGLGPAVV